jgi:hypothetical protein
MRTPESSVSYMEWIDAILLKVVGPDIPTAAIRLKPEGRNVAGGIHGDLWSIGMPGIVGFNQLGRAPNCHFDISHAL